MAVRYDVNAGFERRDAARANVGRVTQAMQNVQLAMEEKDRFERQIQQRKDESALGMILPQLQDHRTWRNPELVGRLSGAAKAIGERYGIPFEFVDPTPQAFAERMYEGQLKLSKGLLRPEEFDTFLEAGGFAADYVDRWALDRQNEEIAKGAALPQGQGQAPDPAAPAVPAAQQQSAEHPTAIPGYTGGQSETQPGAVSSQSVLPRPPAVLGRKDFYTQMARPYYSETQEDKFGVRMQKGGFLFAAASDPDTALKLADSLGIPSEMDESERVQQAGAVIMRQKNAPVLQRLDDSIRKDIAQQGNAQAVAAYYYRQAIALGYNDGMDTPEGRDSFSAYVGSLKPMTGAQQAADDRAKERTNSAEKIALKKIEQSGKQYDATMKLKWADLQETAEWHDIQKGWREKDLEIKRVKARGELTDKQRADLAATFFALADERRELAEKSIKVNGIGGESMEPVFDDDVRVKLRNQADDFEARANGYLSGGKAEEKPATGGAPPPSGGGASPPAKGKGGDGDYKQAVDQWVSNNPRQKQIVEKARQAGHPEQLIYASLMKGSR